jgi:hypothetical protein
MDIPVQRKITIKDIPMTDDMRAMFEANRCPIDEYAETFVGKQSSLEIMIVIKNTCVSMDLNLKYLKNHLK